MRSDYTLYAVAIIFFVVTIMAFALELAEFERNLWVVTTAILGLLFIGLGYTQRPRPTIPTIKAPPPTSVTPKPPEVVTEEKTVIVVETASPKIEITEVKGIGEKRAEQLKALGISSIEDLTKASAEDLAAKLKISPKITVKWIENAKKLVEKS